jgi:hypothetical protein
LLERRRRAGWKSDKLLNLSHITTLYCSSILFEHHVIRHLISLFETHISTANRGLHQSYPRSHCTILSTLAVARSSHRSWNTALAWDHLGSTNSRRFPSRASESKRTLPTESHLASGHPARIPSGALWLRLPSLAPENPPHVGGAAIPLCVHSTATHVA